MSNLLQITKVTEVHNLVTCKYDMPNPDHNIENVKFMINIKIYVIKIV